MLRPWRTLRHGRALAQAPLYPAIWMALLWAGVGASVLVGATFAGPGQMASGTVTVIGVGALAVSGSVAVAGARMPSWVFPGLVGGGVVVVSVLMVAAGGGVASAMFSVFHVWLGLYALVFLPGLMAAVAVVSAAVGYGAAHAMLGTLPTSVPVVLAATGGLTGGLVAGLRASTWGDKDGLTGLLNRRGLDAPLQLAMGEAATHDRLLTVALIDIDHFKQVNDRYGRKAGDRLLRAAAQKWTSQLRTGDVLAHLHADAFVAVLPRCNPSQARDVVDTVRAAAPGGVTASAGVAAWRPGDSISMLLARAGGALYEAKRSGRDRTFVDTDDAMAARELARAIERDQLVVYYQPKVNLRTGHITGFEALVRWQHPERGLLPPSQFIGVAEDSGLIVDLGAWVLAEACRQARAWARTFPDQPIQVAVNVAGRQLDDPGIVDTIEQTLAASGLPPRLLTIEITETMLAEDPDAWVERLAGIRDLGVHVAMDDFGTGYSSLRQLRHLPVSTIKLDRSFIQDFTVSPDAATLVSAMIGIGKGLARTLVAEGVETVAQLNELTRLGCDEAQGFLIGRPLPHEASSALLRQQQRLHDLVHATVAPNAPETTQASTDTVRRLAELVVEHLPLRDSVAPLLDQLVAVSDLESAYLTRINWDRLEQETMLAVNTGELQITEGTVIDWSDTVCRRSLETGPARTDAVPVAFPESHAAADLGLQSYATAPVVLDDGSVFGTLCVASRRRIDVSDDLMALLSLYSRIIADRLGGRRPLDRPSETDPEHQGQQAARR